MLLQINEEHKDYIKHIVPYLKNGILLDTCIMKIFIDGFIELRFSKKRNDNYDNLISILELLQINNKWDKFYVTPHVFAEICQHFYTDYDRDKRMDFKEMVKEIIPILSELKEEKNIGQKRILELVDKNKPVIEIGDLSIFVAVENIMKEGLKIAIISKDRGIREKYEDKSKYPHVLMIDFDKTLCDLRNRK
jgi:hypothetical protein